MNSATQIRPRASHFTDNGCRMSGSARTRSTRRSSATRNLPRSSAAESGPASSIWRSVASTSAAGSISGSRSAGGWPGTISPPRNSHRPVRRRASSPAKSTGAATLNPVRPSRRQVLTTISAGFPAGRSPAGIRNRSGPPKPLRNRGGNSPAPPTDWPLAITSTAASNGSTNSSSDRPSHFAGKTTRQRYHPTPSRPRSGCRNTSGTVTGLSAPGSTSSAHAPPANVAIHSQAMAAGIGRRRLKRRGRVVIIGRFPLRSRQSTLSPGRFQTGFYPSPSRFSLQFAGCRLAVSPYTDTNPGKTGKIGNLRQVE